MSKIELNFNVNGRKLFDSEKVAMQVFDSIYGPNGTLPSDAESRAEMAKVKAAALKAQRDGTPV
jgi:hypothetical protein